MSVTDIHMPGDQAPTVTNKVAHCKVCGAQWQMKADSDKMGCKFCDAPESAITIISEAPSYSGYVLLR